MQSTLVYELLQTFDKNALIRFGKWVRSPFFTHRAELGQIYAMLAQCLYRRRPLPDKATLFESVFPGKPYDDLLLRATLSDLKEQMEDFLVWQKLHADPVATRLALASALRERNLDRHFHKVLQKLGQTLEHSTEKNADHLRQLLDYQLEIAHFQTRTVRTGDLHLQEISQSLDTLYLAQKLRHACTQMSHQAVFKADYDFGLLPNVLQSVETGGYLQLPAVAMYYYCYRFMTESYSLHWFQQFRAGLANDGHYFPVSELKNLYLLALNFCIRKINEGDEPFIREGWDLYREGLDKGFLLENGRLSGFTFNNVIAFGIKLKAFSEVEQFIRQYGDALEPAQRESFIHFNYARLEYSRRQFGAALLHLQKSDFKDLVNNLIAKTQLLKIYYELGEFNLLDSHLESFRTFIRRSDVSDYHRDNFSNIISFTKKLTMLPPGDARARAKLRAEVQNTRVLSEKEWLMEKLV